MVNDRYQVCDPNCGLVLTEPKKTDALWLALRHSESCDGVEIHDAMARRQRVQGWTPDGTALYSRWA